MNCKNLKKRQRKYKTFIYCNKLKKEICFDNCRNCEYKEYKEYKPIKKRTYKQSKIEKERFSLFTSDLEHCIICGKKKDNLHEVFYGKNRQNSIKYNCILPLCLDHHTGKNGIHSNKKMDLYYKQLCQKKLEENCNRDDFIKLFGRNYL